MEQAEGCALKQGMHTPGQPATTHPPAFMSPMLALPVLRLPRLPEPLL